jgi:mRNA interferase RelE/StbE
MEEAERDLQRLDSAIARRVVNRLAWLAANAESVRHEPLTGDLAGLWKLRVGDYRVLYDLVHQEKVILVHAVGHRREIYRRR